MISLFFEKFISIKGQANACASYPCYNGGSCTPAGASFLCTCASPYTGPQCMGTTSGKIINPNDSFVLRNMI